MYSVNGCFYNYFKAFIDIWTYFKTSRWKNAVSIDFIRYHQ